MTPHEAKQELERIATLVDPIPKAVLYRKLIARLIRQLEQQPVQVRMMGVEQ